MIEPRHLPGKISRPSSLEATTFSSSRVPTESLKTRNVPDLNFGHSSLDVSTFRPNRLLLTLSIVASVVIGLSTIGLSASSNILLVSPVGSRSHASLYGEIVAVLADRGHQMTVVSSYPMPHHPNVTHINVGITADRYLLNSFSHVDFGQAMHQFKVRFLLCPEALEQAPVQQLNISSFDLVISAVYNAECFLSLFYKEEIPIIFFNQNVMTSITDNMVGSINYPSFVPYMGSDHRHPMTFYGRMHNLLQNIFITVMVTSVMMKGVEADCRERGLCPEDMPPMAVIQQRASLMFVNSVRSLEMPPRPSLPSVVDVGGLNCMPARPLPEELESWVRDSGEEGFIYMSLGSAVRPSDMPEEHRKMIVEVFRALPQRVLWKWDQETMEDLPPNVKLSKWLPQQDILGHPKLKLFISHGGLFGITEATYHGVPVLGMPVFGDQFGNLNKVVADGWGAVMEWGQLAEELFREKITMLITEEKYAAIAKRRSTLMRDAPMTPRALVAYWTEYVIRHKGAPHLRSPVLDMAWYQVYNIDVWTFVITTLSVSVLLCLLATWSLVKCCYRRCRRKPSDGGLGKTSAQVKGKTSAQVKWGTSAQNKRKQQ